MAAFYAMEQGGSSVEETTTHIRGGETGRPGRETLSGAMGCGAHLGLVV